MKTKDVPILKKKVLGMLPTTQKEMWETLGIDSREGSDLVSIMLKENLITRTRLPKSFLLERINGNGKIDDIDTSAEEELKKKSEEELKKKSEEELKKKSEEELKKKSEEELKKKSEEELKKKSDISVLHHNRRGAKDITDIKRQILNMTPIIQSDIWKRLEIDSSSCSRIIDSMIEEKVIIRKKLSKSFLIDRIRRNKDEDKKVDYTALVSGQNRFSACCGCELLCNAESCTILTNWLLE